MIVSLDANSEKFVNGFRTNDIHERSFLQRPSQQHLLDKKIRGSDFFVNVSTLAIDEKKKRKVVDFPKLAVLSCFTMNKIKK